MPESVAVWCYIRQILVPDLGAMTLFHDAFPVRDTLSLSVALSLCAHAMAVGAALMLARRLPLIALAILGFYVSHLLESTFFPLDLVFEHRNYFGTWFLLIGVVFFLVPSTQWRTVLGISRLGALAAMMLVFAFMTHGRAMTWGHEELINEAALSVYPNSSRVYTNLANLSFERGELNIARTYLREAVKYSPGEPGPVVHLLATYCKERVVPRDLISNAKELLAQGMMTAYSQNSVYRLSRMFLNDECPAIKVGQMVEILNSTLENETLQAEARYYVLVRLGKIRLGGGDLPNALQYFEQANEERSHAPYRDRLIALEGVAIVALRQGRLDLATQAFGKIDELAADPRYERTKSLEALGNAIVN